MATPNELVLKLITGYIAPRCLHVVAELGIADQIGDASVSVGELARATNTDEGSLSRILRLLVMHGVFTQDGDNFGHTPASRLLRTDHPQSMRAYALLYGSELLWQSFGRLDETARSGTLSYSGGFWAYLRANPDFGKVFNAAMTSKSHLENTAFIAAYDLPDSGIIADIGGGKGHLLQAVLAAKPALRGILFDLPAVLPDPATISSDRLTLQGGDFFKDALPRADIYILSNVIHDFYDSDSVSILAAVARAAPVGSKLVLLEGVIPEGPEPHMAKMLDLVMLTIADGRERTATEYERLLTASGWKITRVIPTTSSRSIIEAVPAASAAP